MCGDMRGNVRVRIRKRSGVCSVKDSLPNQTAFEYPPTRHGVLRTEGGRAPGDPAALRLGNKRVRGERRREPCAKRPREMSRVGLDATLPLLPTSRGVRPTLLDTPPAGKRLHPVGHQRGKAEAGSRARSGPGWLARPAARQGEDTGQTGGEPLTRLERPSLREWGQGEGRSPPPCPEPSTAAVAPLAQQGKGREMGYQNAGRPLGAPRRRFQGWGSG